MDHVHGAAAPQPEKVDIAALVRGLQYLLDAAEENKRLRSQVLVLEAEIAMLVEAAVG